MKFVFWISLALLAYTIVGYPVLAFLRYRLKKRPFQTSLVPRPFNVVIAVRNAQGYVDRKLESIFENAGTGLRDVIVVSDGSSDGTNALLEQWATKRSLRVITTPPAGKTAALAIGIAACTEEIVVFMDIRQVLEPVSISELLAPFHDPEVGAVSGALMIGAPGETRADGETVKMGLENLIREWEGGVDTNIGVTGAFYAARRSLLPKLTPGIILDDMYVPLHIVKQGFRVVFARNARAWDDVQPSLKQEFKRKVRTLTGNYQLMTLLPWLLNPFGRVFTEFVSHKLLRLMLPFLMLLVALSSVFLGGMYLFTFAAQLLFILAALASMYGLLPRPLTNIGSLAATFTLLSGAAVVAFGKFLRRDYDVWVTK